MTPRNELKFTLAVATLAVCASLTFAAVKWNGRNWATGCTFRGNNLSNVRTPSTQCASKCAATKGCTHFSWDSGTCSLKKGAVSYRNAVATGNNLQVCGMDEDPTPGTTTRYWDCCKPSCSWPNKVPGTTQAVAACLKNGVTHAAPTAVSGCTNGVSYACSDQQPWAVTASLAYGFAAAHIPGLKEEDVCCACYRLVFTSTSIKGKHMTVQVTNSGEDVRPHQFDLQIPGGGVGLFNGCRPQWGAGPDGWGRKYGGVSTRSECNLLPVQLRPGCLFRFDWFEGAENPTMVYERVGCPDAIVARSNCRRPGE